MIPERTIITGGAALVIALLLVTPALAQLPGTPALPPHVNVGVEFVPVQTLYHEDFEAGDGGYQLIDVDGTTWEHGIPADPPLPAVGQGPNAWGTNLAGDYDFRECGFVESPPIDLPGPAGVPSSDASAARLIFQNWLDVDRYDGAAVFASTDGEDWDLLVPPAGYQGIAYNTVRQCFGLELFEPVWDNTDPRFPSTGDDWRTEEFDLTPYLGESVQIRWGFASSALGPARGWYFDDVVVQLGAGSSTAVPIPEPPAPSAEFTPLVNVYAEDFEDDDGGWTAEGDADWEWGPFETPPHPVAGSLRAWSTNPDGDHPNPSCGSVTSPPIEIPGLPADGTETARLGFDLWRDTAYRRDGAILQASPDNGDNWYPLEPIGGYDAFLSFASQSVAQCLLPGTTGYAWTGPTSPPGPDDWQRVEVDVTPFAGNEVLFRLLFAADSQSSLPGVYVNDVTLDIGIGADLGAFPPEAPPVTAPGWTVQGQNPSWEYGRVFKGPSSATPAWGTNLAGDYNPNECSAIVSPPIHTSAIPGLGRLTLSFEHHMSTYFRQAGGVVQATIDDGETWDTLTPVGGYPESLPSQAGCLDHSRGFTGGHTGEGFEHREVRLDDHDGGVIQVRFVFSSTSQNDQDVGWYIRNVNVDRDLIGIPLTPAAGDGDGTGGWRKPFALDERFRTETGSQAATFRPYDTEAILKFLDGGWNAFAERAIFTRNAG